MQEQLTFQGVPRISSQDAVVNSIQPYGADTYLFTIERVGEDDYRSYVLDIENSGFVKSNCFEALRGDRYGTIFKKDGKILTEQEIIAWE